MAVFGGEFRCSAPNPRREELVSAAGDVAHITDEFGDIGLEIVDTTIVEETVVQPFDHFGRDVVEAGGAE